MIDFDDWLRSVQGTDLHRRDRVAPDFAKQPVGQFVKDVGGGRVFDTEPAAFFKLLRDMAPKTDKP